ncbi:MAG: hypothetical protein V1750_07200, partial [Acidobacteriota bacterium]
MRKEESMWVRTGVVVLLVIVGTWCEAAPTIGFEANAVVATGLTPGGASAWLSVSRERGGWRTSLSRRDAVLVNTGADGQASFDLERAVPMCSIWAAVDFTTGDSAIGTPEGYPLR